MKQTIAKNKKYAQERIRYWALAEKTAERLKLPELHYCAWKRAQFEGLLECLNRLEGAAA
jgi:hypothetical protein